MISIYNNHGDLPLYFKRAYLPLAISTLLVACGGDDNKAPVITEPTGPFSISEKSTQAVTVSVSDDGEISSQTLTLVSGLAGITHTISGNQITFTTPNVEKDEKAIFSYSVEDNKGKSTSTNIIVDVMRVNEMPVVNGESTFAFKENSDISLEWSITDNEEQGGISAIELVHQSGPELLAISPIEAKSNNDKDVSYSVNATLPILDSLSETIVYSIVASDVEGGETEFQFSISADTVTSNISADIVAPTNLAINESGTLSGVTTLTDGLRGLAFHWEVTDKPENSVATLSSSDSMASRFTADTEGLYTIKMTTSDITASDEAQVSILVDLDGDGILSADDIDRDGDTIINELDTFPDVYFEYTDDDGDGVGNTTQSDEDGDGVSDFNDDYPFDPERSELTSFSEVEFNGNIYPNGNVLTGSMPYRITGSITPTEDYVVDTDYFLFTGQQGQFMSILVKFTDEAFAPSAVVVQDNGVPLNSLIKELPNNQVLVSTRLPVTGTFALAISDKFASGGDTYTYTADVFVDSDSDGVSDLKELAFGSLIFNADSDFDGLIDSFETNVASEDLLDVDNDGVPAYFDRDSDGDGISDSIESGADTDGDGIANSMDQDADGNGIPDAEEFGDNPVLPIDSDNDGILDFADLDDDNDSIFDNYDTSPTVASLKYEDELSSRLNSISASLTIQVDDENTKTFSLDGVLQVGKELSISTSGIEANTAIMVFTREDGKVLNIPVENISNTPTVLPKEFFDEHNLLSEGQVFLYSPDLDKRTNTVNYSVSKATDRVIYGALNDVNGVISDSRITLVGVGFENNSSDYIIVNGESTYVYVYDNANIRLDSYRFDDSDIVTVTTPESAAVYEFNLRDNQTERVGYYYEELLAASTYTNLPDPVVITDLVSESMVVNGYFDTPIKSNSPSIMSLVLPKTDTNETTFVMSGLISSNLYFSGFTPTSTAVAQIYDYLNIKTSYSNNDLRRVINAIQQMDELTPLVELITSKLEADIKAMNTIDEAYINVLLPSLDAAKALVASMVENNEITPLSKSKINTSFYSKLDAKSPIKAKVVRSGLSNGATATPVEDDGFSVSFDTAEVLDDTYNGQIRILNDTSIFADLQLTNANTQKVTRPLINSIWDAGLIGPQSGFWGAYRAGWADPEDVGYQPTIVELYTAGRYGVMGTLPHDTNTTMLIRTLLSQFLHPIIGEMLNIKVSDRKLIKMSQVFLSHPATVTFLEEVTTGEINDIDGVRVLLWKLLKDIGVNGFVDIVSIVVDPKQVMVSISSRIAAYLNPITASAETISAVATTADILNSLYDIVETKPLVKFSLTFPVQITSVSPLSLLADEVNPKVTITGSGFDKVIRKSIYSFDSVYTPAIKFTGSNDISCTDKTPVFGKTSEGEQSLTANLDLKGACKDISGPITVTLLHKQLDEDLLIDDVTDVVLDASDTITLVDEPEISIITPNEAGWGETLTIFGTGFSKITSNNTVIFTDSKNQQYVALVAKSSSNSVEVIVPSQLPENTMVHVDIKLSDGSTLSTNELPFKVKQQLYTFVFGDNGTANDDTFALEVNGVLVKTMTNPARAVSAEVPLANGTHTLRLLGITAPDSIGTYYLDLPTGVTLISGDSLTGDDLTSRGVKNYTIKVEYNNEVKQATRKSRVIKTKIKYKG